MAKGYGKNHTILQHILLSQHFTLSKSYQMDAFLGMNRNRNVSNACITLIMNQQKQITSTTNYIGNWKNIHYYIVFVHWRHSKH